MKETESSVPAIKFLVLKLGDFGKNSSLKWSSVVSILETLKIELLTPVQFIKLLSFAPKKGYFPPDASKILSHDP
jgi:hypothetical protein